MHENVIVLMNAELLLLELHDGKRQYSENRETRSYRAICLWHIRKCELIMYSSMSNHKQYTNHCI